MKKLFLVIFIVLLLAACGNEEQVKLPNDVKYSILEDTHKGNIKRSVEIILESKISKENLRLLAQKIKNSDSTEYQRTFIGYYLNEKEKNGYWATTHYNPNLEVRILGLSKEDEASLTKPVVSTADRKVVGVWIDDRPGIGAKMTIYYSKKGKLFLESTYSDGSSGKKEMKEMPVKNGKRIEDIDGNDFGEYFIINNASQLEFWSENGNYYTAKKVQ